MAKNKTKTKVNEVPVEDEIVITDETKVDEVPVEDEIVVTDETKVDEVPVAEDGIVIVNKKHKKHKLGGQFVV